MESTMLFITMHSRKICEECDPLLDEQLIEAELAEQNTKDTVKLDDNADKGDNFG